MRGKRSEIPYSRGFVAILLLFALNSKGPYRQRDDFLDYEVRLHDGAENGPLTGSKNTMMYMGGAMPLWSTCLQAVAVEGSSGDHLLVVFLVLLVLLSDQILKN